jgi:hypothetical protein
MRREVNVKGKINKDGYLSIKRGDSQKDQYCMHRPDAVGCGDWCPQFGEPDPEMSSNRMYLEICDRKTFCFAELEDLR